MAIYNYIKSGKTISSKQLLIQIIYKKSLVLSCQILGTLRLGCDISVRRSDLIPIVLISFPSSIALFPSKRHVLKQARSQ